MIRKLPKGEKTMGFIDSIKERAKKEKKTIVLPETGDIRILEAADKILKEGIANLILVGDEDAIVASAKELSFEGATFINPKTTDKMDAYVEKLVELRGKKGMTADKALKVLSHDKLYFGSMMVKMGDADGMVAGACHSSADVLRASLQVIKTAPGTKLVSAFFLVVVPDCEYGANGAFIFSDAGLNQNPNPEELAAIAGSSAESFELLIQQEAVVALLSHSTKGSATHPDVDKVVEATRLAKTMYPNLKIDGELQSDAAIVPEVAVAKAPGSDIAGNANVLIFPDLDAANIGYKLVQRLAKAEAYGPVTQGLAAPINDLSRGCVADDIVGVIAITAVQAQAREENERHERRKNKY